MGRSSQSTRANAAVPTTSSRIDQDPSQYLDEPLSPTMARPVDNLARHLAARLNLEPARVRQEIASFHALNPPNNVPIERAQASPSLCRIPSIQEGTILNDPWANEQTKAEPYLAKRLESRGHNRSFSFQRGDDLWFAMPSKHDAEVYDSQNFIKTCLPGAEKTCREQDQAPVIPSLITNQQKFQMSMTRIMCSLRSQNQCELIESFHLGAL